MKACFGKVLKELVKQGFTNIEDNRSRGLVQLKALIILNRLHITFAAFKNSKYNI